MFISQAVSMTHGVVGSLATDFLPNATMQLTQLTECYPQADFFMIVSDSAVHDKKAVSDDLNARHDSMMYMHHSEQYNQPHSQQQTAPQPKLAFTADFYASNDEAFTDASKEMEVFHD